MITADEYYQYTGYLAPADFESCKAMARQQLDACTLYAYVGRDFDSLPGLIQTAWKQALALQTCAISQNGGVAGMSQQPQQSVSLGNPQPAVPPAPDGADPSGHRGGSLPGLPQGVLFQVRYEPQFLIRQKKPRQMKLPWLSFISLVRSRVQSTFIPDLDLKGGIIPAAQFSQRFPPDRRAAPAAGRCSPGEHGQRPRTGVPRRRSAARRRG